MVQPSCNTCANPQRYPGSHFGPSSLKIEHWTNWPDLKCKICILCKILIPDFPLLCVFLELDKSHLVMNIGPWIIQTLCYHPRSESETTRRCSAKRLFLHSLRLRSGSPDRHLGIGSPGKGGGNVSNDEFPVNCKGTSLYYQLTP